MACVFWGDGTQKQSKYASIKTAAPYSQWEAININKPWGGAGLLPLARPPPRVMLTRQASQQPAPLTPRLQIGHPPCVDWIDRTTALLVVAPFLVAPSRLDCLNLAASPVCGVSPRTTMRCRVLLVSGAGAF